MDNPDVLQGMLAQLLQQYPQMSSPSGARDPLQGLTSINPQARVAPTSPLAQPGPQGQAGQIPNSLGWGSSPQPRQGMIGSRPDGTAIIQSSGPNQVPSSAMQGGIGQRLLHGLLQGLLGQGSSQSNGAPQGQGGRGILGGLLQGLGGSITQASHPGMQQGPPGTQGNQAFSQLQLQQLMQMLARMQQPHPPAPSGSPMGSPSL